MPRLLFLAVAAMASAAAATSSQGINFTSQYWTAFLNISYVDSGRQVWHTERSETGRFGSNGVKEATGIAVEIISSVQNPKLRKETLTFNLLKKRSNVGIGAITPSSPWRLECFNNVMALFSAV